MLRRLCLALAISLSAILAVACVRGAGGGESRQRAAEPAIEASPVEQKENGWKIATSDTVSFGITAPGARKVSILHRPVVADADRHVVLREIDAPAEGETDKFTAQLNLPPDFAGEVWARAAYPDGAAKESPKISLTTRTASGETGAPVSGKAAFGGTLSADTQKSKTGANGEEALTAAEQAADTDESARSDKFTGGRLETAPLKPGQSAIRITVNVPAFTLTLWQDGKEVKTYPVGVGRKNFPVPVGMREATEIIFNPAWIPPDSSWVRSSPGVTPYERIEADDPRNPLGKIKIPLGDGYLLHEAAQASDIGHLVSHGCVRVLTDDLFDLAKKIIAARRLSISGEEISRLRANTARRAVQLDEPLPVDINYDTLVVEKGFLHVYPDVYDRGTNTVERLREELRGHGVDASRLDEQTLRFMLDGASASAKFVVKISDIKAGRALEAGRAEPLPGHAGEETEENTDRRR